MMKSTFLVYLFFLPFIVQSQYKSPDSLRLEKPIQIKYKALIIPSALICYGLIGLKNQDVQRINTDTHYEIKEHIDHRLTIDDFSQYSPAIAVYGLNSFGINGKNRFKERTIILATAYLLMATTVTSLKYTTRVERPDGSSMNSFPSGHTATAFLSAEFLYQEYKHESIWYGIAGYAVAAGTGYFRMYNNRHWFTDVATGAGIGILSTKAAYWLYPKIMQFVYKKKKQKNAAILLPFYSDKQFGMCTLYRF